jgi:diaminohydroxyphosphoribosylaminopyrimidine deaminase / 5-amino-6-(5-phosphoribosylamino)uracil reductase
MPPFSDRDRSHMLAALALAERGLGRTWPNPSVGCVIVQRDALGRDYVVGRARTADGGRPHAETQALAQAGDAAKGACVYVTLEPCSHHGRTPPCAEALIAAGVARVMIACQDPDPRVQGAGMAALRQAGISTDSGLEEAAAQHLNQGFFRRIREGRPLIGIKCAASLDGKVAMASGESRWITSPEARRRGHLLRARHDGIVIGVGTALADDPDLSCRLPGLAEQSPVRIVLDRRLRLPLDSALARTARTVPLWLIADAVSLVDAPDMQRKAASLVDCGARILPLPSPLPSSSPLDATSSELPRDAEDFLRAIRLLAHEGMTRLLIEGGPRLLAAALASGAVDEVHWFRAPLLMGDEALGAVAPLGFARLSEALRLQPRAAWDCGVDRLEHYDLLPPSLAQL